MITIIDYGMGNLGSIRNMFRRLGVQTHVSIDPDEIRRADQLLLPGVGHFSNGCKRLDETAVREVLHDTVVKNGTPLLGICVGQQLLADRSQEGSGAGLGWIPGACIRFSPVDGAKVPQMGWNYVKPAVKHPVLSNLGEEPRFYFAHSFFLQPEQRSHVLLESMYGGQRFTAGVACNNWVGFQFHPEKSHRFGMTVLENFSKWRP